MKVISKTTTYTQHDEEIEVDFPEEIEYWYDNWDKDLFIVIPIPYDFTENDGGKGFQYKMILADLSGLNRVEVQYDWDTSLTKMDNRIMNVSNPDKSDRFKRIFYRIYVEKCKYVAYNKVSIEEGEELFEKAIMNINTNPK